LVEQYYPQFRVVYPDRYEKRYGFWRPAIDAAVERFLECGDVHQGFARVRCPECAYEFFVAFSCRGRCFCPSCHEKRALEMAGWMVGAIQTFGQLIHWQLSQQRFELTPASWVENTGGFVQHQH
jgi:hypothetical protein